MASNAQVLLILGMHRSGTSAVAGVAHALGATAPAHLLPPAADNPSGYWESMPLIGVNDWILTQLGAAWYDCLSFDAGTLPSRTRAEALALIMLGVQAEFPSDTLPLIKDPRLCLLLDLWLPALQALNREPLVLLTFRAPHQVAASLASRDGLASAVSLALWLRHLLAAERGTRGCRRHLLCYDTLLADGPAAMSAAARDLALVWPHAPQRGENPSVEPRIRPGLRHHAGSPRPDGTAPPDLLAWCEAAHGAVRDAEAHGLGPAHQRQLDDLAARFAAWCGAGGASLITSLLRDHRLRRFPPFPAPPRWHRIARDLVASGAIRGG
jgi:hypothetical protein